MEEPRGSVSRNREAPGGMINVLFVNTPEHPPLGADTWIHLQIIKHLDRRSHRAHVAYMSGPSGSPTPLAERLRSIPDLTLIDVVLGPERPAAVTVASATELIRSSWLGLWSMARLVRHVRAHHVTVIHTSDRPRDAVASVLLAKLTRTKSIVHVHVVFSSWMSAPLRWAILHADVRIAVSDFVRDSVLRAGASAESTFTVRNAIEPGMWVPGRDRACTRERLSLPADAPVVITICRLFEQKGPGELIRAIATVRETFPATRLLIVGTDPTRDGAFLESLNQSVVALGLENNVHFLGQRSDIAQLLAASDVFAMPSYEEPFGLVFCEAGAMELPVVALDNGGTKEVVVHGQTGLLSDHGDVPALAANIVTLLADEELRQRMGVAGRRRVEEHFDTVRLAAEVARVYRAIGDHEIEAGDPGWRRRRRR